MRDTVIFGLLSAFMRLFEALFDCRRMTFDMSGIFRRRSRLEDAARW